MDEPVNIFIEKNDKEYLEVIRKGLSHLRIEKKIKPGDTVFIKPNLTFPHYREGVMTRPISVENLICALKDYTQNIIIGESDGGGYNKFSMENVFEKTGLADIAKKHNVKLVNLSKLPSMDISFEYKKKLISVPLPTLLLDDVDLFITMPVPKVHANTGVSMSIKNQWGCIQDPSMRLQLHPFFKKVIYEINQALRVGVSFIDGEFGLTRNGPMRGDPVKLGWMLLADNIICADIVCCKIMGIDSSRIDYLNFYGKNQRVPKIEEMVFNQNYKIFIGPQFYLKRDFWDYPGLFAFRSSFLAYVAYHSPFADILHKGLYLFREKFYDHD